MPRKKRLRSASTYSNLPPQPEFPTLYGVMIWLTAITALLYGRTADYPLVFDDITYLQQNPFFTDPHSYTYPFHYREFLNSPPKMGLDAEMAMNFALRPVAYVSFYLNYLFDGFQPRWYRVFNMVIHAANACLIYAVLMLCFRLGEGRFSRSAKVRIASCAATLFALHPLAIESVTYIVQRFTSLAAFFFLLTMLLQIASWLETSAQRQKWLRAAATGVLLLGLFTKECTIAAPLMLFLLDLVVCRTHWRESLRRNRALLACVPIVPLHVLLISWVQNAGALDLAHAMNMTNLKGAEFAHRDFLITQITVYAHYLKLMIWPSGLTLDPEWPLYRSLFDGPVLTAGVILIALLASVTGFYWRDRKDPERGLLMVFTAWFFITLFPSSGLVPLPDLVAEHRSYLPSLGIFILLSFMMEKALARLPEWRWKIKPRPALAAAVIVVLGAVTWSQNTVWSSSLSLWQDVTNKSPGRARAWNNLGSAYTANNQLGEAVVAFNRAVELFPLFEIPYLNLMMCHNHRREFDAALRVREKLKAASPAAIENVHFMYQEAMTRFGLGQMHQVRDLLTKVIAAAPHHRPALILLGSAHLQNHQRTKALHYFERAAAIQRPNAQLQQMINEARSGSKETPALSQN